VRAGETFMVPPDAPHTFTVEADELARFITEFRPGLRLAEFFAQLFWLADHGQIDAKGRIHPLQAAVLARAFPREFFYRPRIPAPLQQAIARPLAALARRRGYTGDPAGLADLAARALSDPGSVAASSPSPGPPARSPRTRTGPPSRVMIGARRIRARPRRLTVGRSSPQRCGRRPSRPGATARSNCDGRTPEGRAVAELTALHGTRAVNTRPQPHPRRPIRRAPAARHDMTHLIVGLGRTTLAPWPTNRLERDAASATRSALAGAGADGVDHLIAARHRTELERPRRSPTPLRTLPNAP
jgi:hypothetical protein